MAEELTMDNLERIYPVIESHVDGTSGYRIWSDGYCEQWGRIINTATNNAWITTFVNFYRLFKDNNYCITTGHQHKNSQVNVTEHLVVYGLVPNGFYLNSYNYVNESINFWRACGYLAEGQY